MRGVQKQIVVVNDTGSELFEQAILIMRPRAAGQKPSCGDMAAEARKVIERCAGRAPGYAGGKRRAGALRPVAWLLAALGAGGAGAAFLYGFRLF